MIRTRRLVRPPDRAVLQPWGGSGAYRKMETILTRLKKLFAILIVLALIIASVSAATRWGLALPFLPWVVD